MVNLFFQSTLEMFCSENVTDSFHETLLTSWNLTFKESKIGPILARWPNGLAYEVIYHWLIIRLTFQVGVACQITWFPEVLAIKAFPLPWFWLQNLSGHLPTACFIIRSYYLLCHKQYMIIVFFYNNDCLIQKCHTFCFIVNDFLILVLIESHEHLMYNL